MKKSSRLTSLVSLIVLFSLNSFFVFVVSKNNDIQSGIFSFAGDLIVNFDDGNYNTWTETRGSYKDWSYYQDIKLKSLSTHDLVNRTVLLKLHNGNFPFVKARYDGGDIRFVDMNDYSELSYFLEEFHFLKEGIFRVRIPMLKARTSMTIRMFYGNPKAQTTSNGYRTFDFFDDFSGDTLNTGKWSVTASGGSYSVADSYLNLTVPNTASSQRIFVKSLETFSPAAIFECRMKTDLMGSVSGYSWYGTFGWNTHPEIQSSSNYLWGKPDEGNVDFRSRKDNSDYNTGISSTTHDSFHTWKIDWQTSSATLYKDSSPLVSITSSIPLTALPIILATSTYSQSAGYEGISRSILWDWVGITIPASITVSTPSVSYEHSSQTIDITDVTATCSNPTHGELDDTEATTHTYTVYTAGGSATGISGDLSWNTGQSEWQAMDVDVSSLTAGNYYVKCTFEDSDAGPSTSDPSNQFTFQETVYTITVSTPSVTFHSGAKTIDVTGVIATCSNPAHSSLDNTEATVHTYRVYTSGGSPTSITGDLSWDAGSSSWNVFGVSISSLSDGSYYVKCTFDDADAEPKTSNPSNTFTISTSSTYSISVSKPTVSYDPAAEEIDITDVTATCSNPAHGALDNTEATVHSYTIYEEGGTSTGLSGDLSWNAGSADWEAPSVDISSLAPGNYYVTCRFRDSDAPSATSSASNTFRISNESYYITLSSPAISYNRDLQQINVTGIIAICSNPLLGELNASEATTYQYQLYSIQGAPIGTPSALSWHPVNESWYALNIDISSLALGKYYIVTTFCCAGAETTNSNPSDSFEKLSEFYLVISAPQITYVDENQFLSITGVIATSTNATEDVLDDSKALVHSYSIYTSQGAPTEIEGELAWDIGIQKWKAMAIDISNLAPDDYYVICLFASFSIPATASPPSPTFTIEPPDYSIAISEPNVSYDAKTKTINIWGVNGTSSNPAIDELTPENTDIHRYILYYDTGQPTGIEGNLTWDEVTRTWYAYDVDVSSLPEERGYSVVIVLGSTAGEESPSDPVALDFEKPTNLGLIIGVIIGGIIIVALVIAIPTVVIVKRRAPKVAVEELVISRDEAFRKIISSYEEISLDFMAQLLGFRNTLTLQQWLLALPGERVYHIGVI